MFGFLNKSSTFFSRIIDSREKNNDANPRGKPRGFGKVLDKNKMTDPVCKMKVDKKTKYFSDYKGEKYYFCSENCKNRFNATPKDFAKDFTKENTSNLCC